MWGSLCQGNTLVPDHMAGSWWRRSAPTNTQAPRGPRRLGAGQVVCPTSTLQQLSPSPEPLLTVCVRAAAEGSAASTSRGGGGGGGTAVATLQPWGCSLHRAASWAPCRLRTIDGARPREGEPSWLWTAAVGAAAAVLTLVEASTLSANCALLAVPGYGALAGGTAPARRAEDCGGMQPGALEWAWDRWRRGRRAGAREGSTASCSARSTSALARLIAALPSPPLRIRHHERTGDRDRSGHDLQVRARADWAAPPSPWVARRRPCIVTGMVCTARDGGAARF